MFENRVYTQICYLNRDYDKGNLGLPRFQTNPQKLSMAFSPFRIFLFAQCWWIWGWFHTIEPPENGSFSNELSTYSWIPKSSVGFVIRYISMTKVWVQIVQRCQIHLVFLVLVLCQFLMTTNAWSNTRNHPIYSAPVIKYIYILYNYIYNIDMHRLYVTVTKCRISEVPIWESRT